MVKSGFEVAAEGLAAVCHRIAAGSPKVSAILAEVALAIIEHIRENEALHWRAPPLPGLAAILDTRLDDFVAPVVKAIWCRIKEKFALVVVEKCDGDVPLPMFKFQHQPVMKSDIHIRHPRQSYSGEVHGRTRCAAKCTTFLHIRDC